MAWQTVEWFAFDSFAFGALPGALVYTRSIRNVVGAEKAYRAGLRAQAAVAGAVAEDDRIAPILPPLENSSHLQSQELPLTVDSVRLTNQQNATTAATLCIIAGILCVIGGIPAFVLQSIKGTAVPSSVYGAIWGATLLLLCLSILSGEAWYRFSRSVSVQIDDWGVVWPERGVHERTRQISWHEAQAFIVASTIPPATWPIRGLLIQQVYALKASDTTFSWRIKNPTPMELQASQALIKGISERTRLPLRDVTTALTTQFWKSSPKIETSSDVLSTLAPLSDYLPKRRSQTPRAWLLGILIVSLVLQSLIPFFFWPATNWLREQQITYYTQLAHQVQLQAAIFADHLNASDNYWPETEDDATTGQRYFFANGEYHLTGTDSQSLMYAWGTDLLNDAAVAVNVAQYWRSKDGYDGVGLLLRRDVGDFNRVAFQVTPDGEWSLWRYHYETRTSGDWHFMDGGASSAIRPGTGAANRLLSS